VYSAISVIDKRLPGNTKKWTLVRSWLIRVRLVHSWAANILELGQGGGRQGRCVGINMQKVHFIQQEARRQGKRVYRVDIDRGIENAFNAMSQAALWQVIWMFKIPDVDLLEQIYEGATVRLAPNDEESATITFNTSVAQGSITSPQLFNIFINALLRTLTVTLGQNENISLRLQIGKDQKGDNQRDETVINSTT